jgi:hypothetical protein
MPRTSYYRKRPGYRAHIASLYSVVRPFMEPAPLDQGVPDVLGLRAEGLSAEQIGTARALLAELGDLIRAGLGVVSLPTAPPDFFALGAEMPSSRFSGSPRLRYHLKPKGRPRKIVARQRRVDQADVDVWMRDRAVSAFSQGEPALKEASIVAECMAAIGASRDKARAAFSRLPLALRRQRGQHDRWVPHQAPDPDVQGYATCIGGRRPRWRPIIAQQLASVTSLTADDVIPYRADVRNEYPVRPRRPCRAITMATPIRCGAGCRSACARCFETRPR